jgi:hypothetical protein
MASDPIDCTASAFRATNCSGCGTNVVAAVGFTGESMCLGCRRTAEGIDWESQDLIGEWHPAVGYPRELEWLPRLDVRPPTGTEWRWSCVTCRAGGPAESAAHADALRRIHDGTACSATAHTRSAEARADRGKPRPPLRQPNAAAREYEPKIRKHLRIVDHPGGCRCGEVHPVRCRCAWDSAEKCPVPHGVWLSQKDRDGVARR